MQLTRRQEALIRSLSTRHGRKGSEFCICDGFRSSREILNLRPDLVELLILREDVVLRDSLPVEPLILPAAEFDRISNTVIHSQGIMVVARRPEKTPREVPVADPFVLLLDRVGDPGNFGTIIRTARAAGLREIWMTKGSVDPYSDKAVRSASGAQFALTMREYGALDDVVELLRAKGYSNIFRTAPGGGHSIFTEPELFAKSVIVLGSEGGGSGRNPRFRECSDPDARRCRVAECGTGGNRHSFRACETAECRRKNLKGNAMDWLEEPLFRPPAEAESLIFQVSRGCPHNACRFCGMYKGVRYCERPLRDIFGDIDRASESGWRSVRRIFLADGDAMFLPFGALCRILEYLNEKFPRLTRVTMYANGSSVLSKTPEALERLHKLKLSLVYMGLESGNEDVLRLAGKDDTAAHMTEAVRRLRTSGIKTSVMILAGIGGRRFSDGHVRDTASVLKEMQPEILSLLRFIEVPGLKMYEGYEPLTEYGSVREMRDLIAGLELASTVFRANHSSVPFPLEGRFPKDRERMTALLDQVLAEGSLDRNGAGRVPLFL